MDLLTSLLFIALAFYLGWVLRGVVVLSNLSEDPDRIIKLLEKIKKINEEETSTGSPANTTGTELRIERVGDILYAYSKDDNQFVAQGVDLASVLESAKKRFPDTVFFGNISKDNTAKELV
jgi:hypothetical protein